MNNSNDNTDTTQAMASPVSTMEALLDQQRDRVPIASAFLQERGGQRRPGPLHLFIRERRWFALKLYLLLHCVAMSDPWDGHLPAAVWARALGHTGRGAESTVARNWTWLEDQDLVRSTRQKRMRRVFLLKEDGCGDAYSRPDGKDFFTLPLAYFSAGFHDRLGPSGTAALLIARNLQQPFQLRTERASGWYGVSPDTLQRGLDALEAEQVLDVQKRRVEAPKLRQGWTMVNEYRLQGVFEKTTVRAAVAETAS